jgi:hypothetical protein
MYKRPEDSFIYAWLPLALLLGMIYLGQLLS